MKIHPASAQDIPGIRICDRHFESIWDNACAIEQRLDDCSLRKETLISENERSLRLCRQHGCECILLEDIYDIHLGGLWYEKNSGNRRNRLRQPVCGQLLCGKGQ